MYEYNPLGLMRIRMWLNTCAMSKQADLLSDRRPGVTGYITAIFKLYKIQLSLFNTFTKR